MELLWKEPRGGHSLRMWYDYFPNAQLHAFDIVAINHLENDRTKVFNGDEGNRQDLQSAIDKFGGNFDFILEDGSHHPNHQQISFGYLFKYVKSGGIFIIEDILNPAYTEHHQWKYLKNESTALMLQSFKDNGKINSEFMTDYEIGYLNNNIKSIDILPDCTSRFLVGIIKKC